LKWEVHGIPLICPACKAAELGTINGEPACGECGRSYNVVDGLPLLFRDPSHVALLESDRKPVSMELVQSGLKRPMGHKGAQLMDLITPDLHRIAELGPGLGQHLQRLQAERPDRELVGVEISPEIARAVTKAAPFPYILAEAEHLPIPSETFDAVFSVAAFSHFQDTGAVIKEMHRVLRPGGKAVLVTENPLFITYRLQFILGSWRRFSAKMGRHFVNSMAAMDDWIDMFSRHGFTLEENLSCILKIGNGRRSTYLWPRLGNLVAKHFAFRFSKNR